jgi:hypothetical protein
VVKWKALENHTVYLNSEDGAECIALLDPFFAARPEVEHAALVIASAE